MPTFLSDQLTNAAATPKVDNDAAGDGGKLRIKAFTWTGDAAQNDLVQLCKLPKGARIIKGTTSITALGASVTLALGDGTTAGKYATGVDVSGATEADFANTWALYGLGREQLAADIVLTATLGGANPASGTIRGVIHYTVE